ncbi:MAG: MFS transporter [Chloroflexota bacterium]
MPFRDEQSAVGFVHTRADGAAIRLWRQRPLRGAPGGGAERSALHLLRLTADGRRVMPYNGAMQSPSTVSTGSNRVATLLAFMLGHFGHHLCTAAMVPLLPMIRDSFALDYLRSGLLLSAFSLTYGLAQLPMAAISDRLSKRLVISLGMLGTGAACIGLGLSDSYAQLMLSLILMGVAGSTYHAPASAFLSQTFEKEARGRALGVHIIGGSAGLMAAPLVAILVANVTGSWRSSFVVLGVPILLAGLLVWTLARAQERVNVKAAAREDTEPLHLLQLLRMLGLLVIIAMLTQLLVSAINSFLPLFLVDRHGTPQDVAGLMMSIVFGAGLLGAPLGGALSDRLGRKPVILLSVVGLGPLIALMTILPFGLAMTAVVALYGLFIAFRLPAIESLIADLVPARRRATVLGGYYFLAQETTGVSTPVLGWMMDQFGVNNGLAAVAAIALGCSLLVLLLWRKV